MGPRGELQAVTVELVGCFSRSALDNIDEGIKSWEVYVRTRSDVTKALDSPDRKSSRGNHVGLRESNRAIKLGAALAAFSRSATFTSKNV